MLRKIPCDWFLTDGILPPTRLGAPVRVMDALLRSGVVKDDGRLISRLNREWVFRRYWRYSARFAAPAYDGARAFLLLDGLFGKYRVRLNGQTLLEGENEGARVEVTGKFKDENTLEVEFAPEDTSAMIPRVGLTGQMLLYDCGETAILQTDASFEKGKCNVVTVIDAPFDGEVQLSFTLTSDGEALHKKIYTNVTRGQNQIECTPFTRVPEGRASLEMNVKRDEITSDRATIVKYVQKDAAAARGFQASDAFSMAVTARAGGNAVVTNASMRAYTLAADRELSAYAPGTLPVNVPGYAVSRMETLMELCGGDIAALDNEALWRLSGITEDVFAPCRQILGEGASLEKKIDASRYLQAISLRYRAQQMRIKDMPLMLAGTMKDGGGAFASRALFDKNDRPRPAYFALMQAWKKEHAFAVQPEDGVRDGVLTVPIHYVCDPDTPPATVSARAYSIRGEELMAANFPVMGSSSDVIGRLCVETGEDDFVIVRVKVLRENAETSACDTLIFPAGGLVSAIPETQLLARDGEVENVGDAAAVGVCIPGADYFGAVLPGECIQLNAGRPGFAEGLNIIL